MPGPTSITWSVLTPRAPGAIALIALEGNPSRIDSALASLAIAPVAVGNARVATLRHPITRDTLDRAVVARFTPSLAHIMAHGGTLIVDSITAALSSLSIPQLQSPPHDATLLTLYPEAADLFEARALFALAHAASPLAVDLLMDQPRRHRLASAGQLPSVSPDSARRLRHLLIPPLVVAVGPSNVGKSSLINALAGRDAAIVADEPGTTRDHVGVHLDLAGLRVRWLDTPGLRDFADPIEADAIDLALAVANSADLLVVCSDLADRAPFTPTYTPPHTPPRLAAFLASTSVPRLAVGLRADLSRAPAPAAPALAISIHDRASLDALAARVRDTLLGTSLGDPGAWRFWD